MGGNQEIIRTDWAIGKFELATQTAVMSRCLGIERDDLQGQQEPLQDTPAASISGFAMPR